MLPMTRTVLVVDDDHQLCALLADVLTEAEYMVSRVRDGHPLVHVLVIRHLGGFDREGTCASWLC